MTDYWTPRKNFKYYGAIAEFISRYKPKGGRLLDVGSGLHAGADYHKKFKKCKITSIERPTAQSQDYTHPSGIVCFFREMDNLKYTEALELASELRAFDIVLCSQMLEHLNNPSSVVDFMRFACKPDGVMIISTPYKWRHGLEPGHIQDPVDEKKVYGWVEEPPTECKIVWDGASARQIFVYANAGIED